MSDKSKLIILYLVITALFVLLLYLKPNLSGMLGLISSQLIEFINNQYIKSIIFILAADTIPLLILANVYVLLVSKILKIKSNILIYLVLFVSSLSHLQFVLSPGMSWIGRILLISLCSIMCFITWYIWSEKKKGHEIKNT